MSCNYCYGPFRLFLREKRCPSCGFSYCDRCLNNKIFVKQLNAEKKVCVKCSKYNSSGEVHLIPPPDYYRKIHRRKKESESKSCENNNDTKTQPDNKNKKRQNVKSSNVSNKNGNAADENSPSTSNYHQRINQCSSENESNSEKSEDDEDLSEESDDDFNDEDIEMERSSILDLKITHPHLYDTKNIKKETKSTDEILRDAIKQLQEGLGDKLEAFRKRPPKCTICSTKALVRCKGCVSTFCMRCFDMHSDEVCVAYETLETHEN
ncbi:PREDICTED: vacuolar protein sorting-associated protein 27-like [Papilio xuthus]|uniref:Vacuolar protein sorting-associated protein 27-like n=1 Tax=Papilio xuthus TaxID=66420 RepID=A0AAJ6ZDY5_PAPXU|nr:PREDICTED: vacuolar protein sorting-associated protein 27-like [Papilio xuthus]